MNIIKVIKQKETYLIVNTSLSNGYYNVIKKGCNVTPVLFLQGNLEAGETFLFNPDTDGEYLITLAVSQDSEEVEYSTTLTHYTVLTGSVVDNITNLLCSCGCPETPTDCMTVEQMSCLSYQNLFGEIMLLSNLIRSVNTCKDNTHIVNIAIANAIEIYKCDLHLLFCQKDVEEKIKGQAPFNKMLISKIIGIMYLILYLNEKEITSPNEESLKYLDTKYNYAVIKDCISKMGIDITTIEYSFYDTLIEQCEEETGLPIGEGGCFTPVEIPQDKNYEYDINHQLNTIIDTVILTNTCTNIQLFANRVLYKDANFKLLIRTQSINNPTSIGPGETISVNIVAVGTSSVYKKYIIPFVYEGIVGDTYNILFRDIVDPGNRPPIITAISKILNDSSPYTFKIADFENHFIDLDGDIMDKVLLVGNTSNFTLNGLPYVSGTIITRANIGGLVCTPIITGNDYSIVLQWAAYDDKGNKSN